MSADRSPPSYPAISRHDRHRDQKPLSDRPSDRDPKLVPTTKESGVWWSWRASTQRMDRPRSWSRHERSPPANMLIGAGAKDRAGGVLCMYSSTVLTRVLAEVG